MQQEEHGFEDSTPDNINAYMSSDKKHRVDANRKYNYWNLIINF